MEWLCSDILCTCVWMCVVAGGPSQRSLQASCKGMRQSLYVATGALKNGGSDGPSSRLREGPGRGERGGLAVEVAEPPVDPQEQQQEYYRSALVASSETNDAEITARGGQMALMRFLHARSRIARPALVLARLKSNIPSLAHRS